MEMLLGTGHGDIKQTALFLDLRRIALGLAGFSIVPALLPQFIEACR
jgi:hypothetical protein